MPRRRTPLMTRPATAATAVSAHLEFRMISPSASRRPQLEGGAPARDPTRWALADAE